MRLRSLTKHLREQNWFAVGLDFVIVVFGVGAALAGQQALSDRQARSDYDRALLDLRSGVYQVYYSSKERLAVRECRKARYLELGTKLMKTDTAWPGMPHEYSGLGDTVFPRVLRSPQRLWTSALWAAELAKGTFDLMDEDIREEFAHMFASGSLVEQKFQFDVSDMEANLQALAFPLKLSLGDRLRYFDLLTRSNAASSTIEVVASQNIERIERIRFLTPLNDDEASEVREELAQQNERLASAYGDCLKPIVYPHLENREVQK